MSKNKKESKSSNQKDIRQSLMPCSVKIIIQFFDDVLIELSNSLLFHVYIKSFLLSKNLKLKETYELQLMNRVKKFSIIDSKASTNEDLLEFSINEETEIQVFNLENQILNLCLSDTTLNMLPLNNENFNQLKEKKEVVKIVGFEKEIKAINNLIDLVIFERVKEFCVDFENIPSV